MFQTKLCDLLGIKYPILQGALTGVSNSPLLAAAVSNAGGLGVIATFDKTSKEIKQQIAQLRALTDKPFGLNIISGNITYMKNMAELAINEMVNIVTMGRGNPTQSIISMLKGHGIIVLPIVPTVRNAIQVESNGADAIIASGMEAGGHVGTICSLPLIPQVVDAVKIPVVAAGGIGDARGFVAALALGAAGIQLGTRFLASLESGASRAQKQKILDASEEDTITTSILTGKNARVIKTPVLTGWLKKQNEISQPQNLQAFMHQIRQQHKNNPDFNIAAGQISGMINRIEPTGEIIGKIVNDAADICKRLDLLLNI